MTTCKRLTNSFTQTKPYDTCMNIEYTSPLPPQPQISFCLKRHKIDFLNRSRVSEKKRCPRLYRCVCIVTAVERVGKCFDPPKHQLPIFHSTLSRREFPEIVRVYRCTTNWCKVGAFRYEPVCLSLPSPSPRFDRR